MTAAIEPTRNQQDAKKLPDPLLLPQGYIAEPGQNLEDIANEKGIPIEKLKEANPSLNPYLLQQGQFINLPDADVGNDVVGKVGGSAAQSVKSNSDALAFANTGASSNAINSGNETSSQSKSAFSNANSTQYGPANLSQTIAANTKQITGPDKSADVRKDAGNQIEYESKLNSGDYSKNLHTSANKIKDGSANLPDGTYRQTAPQTKRLGTTRPDGTQQTNALEVGQFSGNGEQRIAQYDRDIATKNKELQQLQAQDRMSGSDPYDVAPNYKGEISFKQAEISKLKDEKGTFINNARLQSSRSENAKMYQALDNPTDADKPPVIFINGVNTDKSRSALQAMELSNELHAPVNHVVNVSSMDKMVKAGMGIVGSSGFDANDGDARIQQHLSGNKPAATTTANAILDQLYDKKMIANNTPVKIIGYSQGAAIGAEALRDVESHLSTQVAKGSLKQADKEKMLDRVRFLGVGPAADARHITQKYVRNADGSHSRQTIADLARVKYRTVADVNDPIPKLVSVGKNGVNASDVISAGLALKDGKILPHLSYFKQYENTDPGSNYNPQFSTELNNWYSGKAGSVSGNAQIDQRGR